MLFLDCHQKLGIQPLFSSCYRSAPSFGELVSSVAKCSIEFCNQSFLYLTISPITMKMISRIHIYSANVSARCFFLSSLSFFFSLFCFVVVFFLNKIHHEFVMWIFLKQKSKCMNNSSTKFLSVRPKFIRGTTLSSVAILSQILIFRICVVVYMINAHANNKICSISIGYQTLRSGVRFIRSYSSCFKIVVR